MILHYLDNHHHVSIYMKGVYILKLIFICKQSSFYRYNSDVKIGTDSLQKSFYSTKNLYGHGYKYIIYQNCLQQQSLKYHFHSYK